MVVCPQHENLNMLVIDGSGEKLAEDLQQDWYPFVVLNVDGPTDQGRSLITESWHELQVVPLSGGAFRGLIVRLCLGEHRVVVSQIDLEEGRRHLRIEAVPAPLDFSTNGLAVSPFPIRTSGSHRIEGVYDGHQATEFGNVVGLEPVWIAASIPALMVVSDTSEQFTHSGNVLENTEADVGMLLDEIEFLVVESTRFRQDGFGDTDLPHIVNRPQTRATSMPWEP